MNNRSVDVILDFLFAGGGAWNIFIGVLEDISNVLRLVSIILGIILMLSTIISKLIRWFKKAKADGKITKEELEEGVQIVIDGVNQINNTIEEAKDGNQIQQ